jgi:uncharacterized phage protein gp47/JayE
MSAPLPRLDDRDARAVLADLRARVPGYLPEWPLVEAHAADDGGQAMLAVLARYRHVVNDAMARAPHRLQLAFLETLGHALMPGQAARVPLVFELLPTSPQDVNLPAHSQVAAKLPPPPASVQGESEAELDRRVGNPPRYYTTRSVALSRARLAALYSADPASDAYVDHSANAVTGFVAFNRLQGMRHELYLGHDALFALAGVAEVMLSFDLAGGPFADRGLMLSWEYLSVDGWLPLSVEEDTTVRLTQDGRIHLRKTGGPDAKRDVLEGRKAYWLRACASNGPARARVGELSGLDLTLDDAGALQVGDVVTLDGERTAQVEYVAQRTLRLDRMLPGLREGSWLRVASLVVPLSAQTEEALGEPPRVDLIRARVGFSKTDLKPELAYVNVFQLDTGNVFHPFGVQPQTYSTFYLASAETFTRRSATVEIAIELKQAGAAGTNGLTLVFEYFDGTDWKKLATGLPTKFEDNTDRLQSSGSWRFVCPDDWAETTVNGKKSHWLRVRIDSGDYGEPIKLEVVTPSGGSPTVSATASNLAPPVIARLTLNYTYFTESQLLDHCLAFNNFVFVNHSEDVRWTRRPFAPFLHNAEREPALHFGFDQRLPAGLTSVLVDVPPELDDGAAISPYQWEYRVAEGWSELTVLDETAGFRRRGMLQFVAPADAVATAGLGGTLYRFRARLKAGARMQATTIATLRPNAVWGMQGEAVPREQVGRSDGAPEQIMVLPAARVPVLSGETVEIREWSGKGEGWRIALEDVPESERRYERDPVTQAPRAVWVRWQVREHLYDSGPNDRHYTLERTHGSLRFGDGRRGRIPIAGAPVTITFTQGIGIEGNVAAGTITELRTGAAYLQAVNNPIAAEGGAAAESLDAVVGRASARVRHRRRALAVDDYEWLAREASPAVARARCLRVTGGEGRAQPGSVSVVVVPHGKEPCPMPTLELRRRVVAHLAAHCPPGVATRVRAMAPRYVAVGVLAHVRLADQERIAMIESTLRQRLNDWMHPLTGNGGMGWPFGARVCVSQVAALIESTTGVQVALRVALRADGANTGDTLTLPADALPCAAAHEIVLSV